MHKGFEQAVNKPGFGWMLLTELIAVLRMIRPINCLMIGFAVIVGEFIAIGRVPQTCEAMLGSLSAALLMAGTMAINDYYDIEIDRINRPDRPLPSGAITPNQAIGVGLGTSAVGLATAALISVGNLAIAAFALSLMIYYNTRGKKSGLFGNVLVSICIGLPFIFGGAAVGKVTLVLIFFSATSFTANLGREVTKGIMDVEGDRLRIIRTVAVVRGSKTASRLAAALYLVAVGLSLAPSVLQMVNMGYLPIVLVSDVGFVSSSVSLLRQHDKDNAGRIKSRVMIWMLIGLLAFITGSINA